MYSHILLWGGVPAEVIGMRFTDKEIIEHERELGLRKNDK